MGGMFEFLWLLESSHKSVEMGATAWRMLMGANGGLFIEGFVMCFMYTPMWEGVVLTVVSFIAMCGVGCQWKYVMTIAVIGGWVIIGYVIYKLYDLGANDSSDLAGWFIFVITALLGLIATVAGTGYLLRQKWRDRRSNVAGSDSTPLLEDDYGATSTELGKDRGGDFGVYTGKPWAPPAEKEKPSDYTKRVSQESVDDGADFGRFDNPRTNHRAEEHPEQPARVDDGADFGQDNGSEFGAGRKGYTW